MEAHRGAQPKHAAMSVVKRFIISTIGMFCLMLGLTGLLGSNPDIFSVVWIILGLAIVWFFLAKPEMDKRRSAASPKTHRDPEVSLIFNPKRILIRSPDDKVERDWQELIEYKKTKKGVHLYFLDGTAIWLPENVFYDKDEMRELMQLLQSKVPGPTFPVSGSST